MTLLTETKRILRQNNIRPKKGLGQHFLIDEQVVKQIISAAELSRDDVVLEIGAGIGILTTQLVPLVAKVMAIEIDPNLINILHQELAGYNNVLVIKDDILKVKLAELFKGEGKVKVIANLPYYIVTPVITHLLQAKENFSTLILMVQKEVGERICAPPGTKEYGALSVFAQYHSRIELICQVSRECFSPQPKVDSVVLRLDILDTPAISVNNEQFFFKVVKGAFSKRRKMLINAISDIGISKDRLAEVLVEARIDLKRRGETLSLEEFGRVSDLLREMTGY
ncbi:MAG: 16S rRNA (adenine(1518)-N(6)/adenine(1519)-N(6))-dimethyltransferase RsmA [bacterium]|nr:16S rRNA (adenine(1518)-N(6)/adenine(1519)-N(6))-dimethyltransferase RsmA [bacterium]